MRQIIKNVVLRLLSPASYAKLRNAVFRYRAFKRIILRKPRAWQEYTLEKYRQNPGKKPELLYTLDDVLALPSRDVERVLMLSVMYLNTAGIKGDIAEFGTMTGLTARTIATAMVYDPERQPYSPLRKLRLFDSFEGLPEITSAIDLSSPHVLDGGWSKGKCLVLVEEELRKAITAILPPERVEISKGWFSETVPKLSSDTRFAMIHFDGDLYQSTIDALTPCFERGFISRGAVICFDEWNSNQADPAYGERKAWSELVEKFGIISSNCGDYGSISTRFIIHAYKGIK